jgi:S-methylmethionine-dependent homocysteine/selenocysteine methylase
MGSVGPYGAWLCDGSEYHGNYIVNLPYKELYDWHKPRIQALIEAGIDVVLFETIPSVDEAIILLDILTEFPFQKACLSFSCKVIILFYLFIINILLLSVNSNVH